MAALIIVEDNDDRPERMLRDPDRYFAEARLRAEEEIMRQSDHSLRRAHHHHKGR
jgi:hypothetical protein